MVLKCTGGYTMNSKTVLAFLVALAMVTPIAAFAAPSSDAADEDTDKGVNVGDAWGAQIEISEEAEAIKFLEKHAESFGTEIEEPENMEIVEKLIQSIVIRGAFIGEVVRADESGHTVRTDGGFSVEIDVEYDGKVSELIDNMPDVDVDKNLYLSINAAVAVVSAGVINFDTDSKITSADISADFVIGISISTNVDLTNIDSENPFSFFNLIGDDVKNSTVTAGMGLSWSYTSTPEAGIGITAEKIGETGMQYELTVGGKSSSNFSAYIAADGYFVESMSEMFRDIIFPGVEIPEDLYDVENGKIQSGFSSGETVTLGGMSYTLVIEKEGEPDNEDLQEYRIVLMSGENKFFETTEKMKVISLPESFKLSEIEVDRNSGAFLKGEQKNAVRAVSGEIQRTFDEKTSGISFNVTFCDEDGKEIGKETVGYGDTVSPLAYDDKKDDDGNVTDKFVGWKTKDGLMWNFGWGVKSQLTLVPVFAKSVDDAVEAGTYMMSGPGVSAYVKVDVKKIGDFDAFDYSFDGLLFVDVWDGDRYMYSWTIENNGGAVSAGTVMKLNAKTVTENGDIVDLIKVSYAGEPMRISFDASGVMPGKTTVNYNVEGSFADGTKIQIMHVVQNEDGEAVGLEPVGTSAVCNGSVSFELAHCSDYVLLAIPSPAQDDSGSVLLYAGLAIVAVIAIIAVAAVLHRRHAA